MAKTSSNPVPDLNADWGRDEQDAQKRPYSGAAVQEFLKSQISSLIASNSGKVGDVKFDGSSLVFYDEEGGQVITTISLSGSTYTIEVDTHGLASSFYVLTSEDKKEITVTPSTLEGSIGSADTHDFPENYTWVLSVDSGSGFIERKSGECADNESITADIRQYLTTGNNRVRLTITGVESRQTRSVIFTAILTTLALDVNHAWNNAWIEGDNYALTGITFSGAIKKTLHVLVDNKQHYTQEFLAGTRYDTTSYSYSMTDKFPATTGVHSIDVWMTGDGGVETRHFNFNVMCVMTDDVATAKLVCINNVVEEATNYLSQNLFAYASYGTPNIGIKITASDGDAEYEVHNTQETITVGTKNYFNTRIEIPTEKESGVSLSVELSAGDKEVSKSTTTIAVNNKNQFPAVDGALFYLNSAMRSNSEPLADRTIIKNTAPNATQTEYPATVTEMAWAGGDGWTTDANGVKCLCVQAGSTFDASGITPLDILNSRSLSLEMKLRTKNIADYDKPILSFMNTAQYDAQTTRGVVLFPTKIVVLTASNRDEIKQSVSFEEDMYAHVVVVFQREYGTTGRNLCRIYINGVPQCNFEYSGSLGDKAYLRIGQQSADINLYMLRYYNNALEPDSVLKNYLSSLNDIEEQESGVTRRGVQEDNNVVNGNTIDYQLVKKAGFNTMVIETDNGEIPDLDHNTKFSGTTMSVEFADNPDKNFTIINAPLDGQGTTSMKYYRWNLRWKCDGNTTWHYPNAQVADTTKKGWFDGENVHPKVSKITAKKNVASSGQGHKMGATALYNDLYEHIKVNINSDKPQGARTAVYQYPVVGFVKAKGSDEYRFIGLYTIGPDKGDSGTFGYDAERYPSFLSLEGPNHKPLGTRFLHPWKNVDYDAQAETVTYGYEEGWDIDDCPYDKETEKDAILTLVNAEWKPAYELVFNCSTYLRKLSTDECGYDSLAELNAHIEDFRGSRAILGNRQNEVLCLYDDQYRLIAYNNATKVYEILDHNVNTWLKAMLQAKLDEQGEKDRDLNIEFAEAFIAKEAPTTDDFIAARREVFRIYAKQYFNVSSAVFHACFCFLIGASDNDAKNTYPFKFRTLAEGGRWEWRQDDLDTILPTDNNGNSTKDYWIEPGDLAPDGGDIFQGSSSVFWTLIRDVFRVELRDMMMINIFGAMEDIADKLGIKAGSLWETTFNVFEYYFWSHSAKYFPATLYSEDTLFAYISVWLKNPTGTYNNVAPLSQALGTQYEAERQWVLRRIIYTMSKYNIGGFLGSNDDKLGILSFTPGNNFRLHITPAITMYPSANSGGGDNYQGQRTSTGTECTDITTGTSTDTTFYVKALDWITSLGDLSGMKLNPRSGATTVNFEISSKRMRDLKVGDEDPEKVIFNAASLAVSGESFEVIDARNTKHLNQPVSLKNLPRLKRALFGGSTATGLELPRGAKVNEVSFPDRTSRIYLDSLPSLTKENMLIPEEALGEIEELYYRECPKLKPVDFLRGILDTEGNKLKYVTMIMTSQQNVQASDISLFAKLADGTYGRMLLNEQGLLNPDTSKLPDLQGTIHTPIISQKNYDLLKNNFSLEILYDKLGIFFADAEVERVLVASTNPRIDTDGDGMISETEAKQAISIPSFKNSAITAFGEFELFGVTIINDETFDGASSIKTFSFPSSVKVLRPYAFRNSFASDSNIIVNLPNLETIGVLYPTNIASRPAAATFYNSKIKRVENLGNITEIPYTTHFDGADSEPSETWAGVFQNCRELEYVNLPKTIRTIGNDAFRGCSKLSTVTNLEYVTSVGVSAFYMSGLSGDLYMPNLTYTGNTFVSSRTKSLVFSGTKISRIISLGHITSIPGNWGGGGMFFNCDKLSSVVLNSELTSIGTETFKNCVSLKALISFAEVPPELGSDVFTGCPLSNGIYVPDESVDAYKSAGGWSTYAAKIKPISSLTPEQKAEYGIE